MNIGKKLIKPKIIFKENAFYRTSLPRLIMGSISKSLALLLVVALAVSSLSLMMVKPAFAQTATGPTVGPTPTPSVPTFTVQLVGPPVRVNTTYSLDPNTGQIVADLGYTNPYSYIVLTIKNQPFDSSYGSLYYNVQIDGNNLTNKYISLPPEQTAGSDYTKLSYSITDYSLVGTQATIRVQAILGTYFWGGGNPTGDYYVFNGATSPWSSTQTVNVPANTPLSPAPTPSSSTSTLTPTQTPTSTSVSSPSYASLLLITTVAVIVIAFLLAAIISLLCYIGKRNRLAKVAKKEDSL